MARTLSPPRGAALAHAPAPPLLSYSRPLWRAAADEAPWLTGAARDAAALARDVVPGTPGDARRVEAARVDAVGVAACRLAERHRLTLRHAEVLRLLLAGLPDQRIAERLGVPLETARERRRQVLVRVGVRDRDGLSALAGALCRGGDTAGARGSTDGRSGRA